MGPEVWRGESVGHPPEDARSKLGHWRENLALALFVVLKLLPGSPTDLIELNQIGRRDPQSAPQPRTRESEFSRESEPCAPTSGRTSSVRRGRARLDSLFDPFYETSQTSTPPTFAPSPIPTTSRHLANHRDTVGMCCFVRVGEQIASMRNPPIGATRSMPLAWPWGWSPDKYKAKRHHTHTHTQCSFYFCFASAETYRIGRLRRNDFPARPHTAPADQGPTPGVAPLVHVLQGLTVRVTRVAPLVHVLHGLLLRILHRCGLAGDGVLDCLRGGHV